MFWKVFKIKRKEGKPTTWLDQWQATSRAYGLRVSDWLQRKTVNLPRGRLKLYAVLFLLFFGSWNGWIIVQALVDPKPATPSAQIHLSHPTLPAVRSPVDPFSLAGIQKFRCWLDSLHTDTVGQKIYDSIQHSRPGLLDSLQQIEKTYSIHH
jgi:hypothetical protein